MLVVSPYQLILWARQKSNLLKEKGVWNAPSEEEEKLIALKDELNVMKKQFRNNHPVNRHPSFGCCEFMCECGPVSSESVWCP